MNRCYSGDDSSQRDQPVPYTVEGEPGDRFDPRLGDDILAVGKYSVVADYQLLSDLLTGAALHDKP